METCYATSSFTTLFESFFLFAKEPSSSYVSHKSLSSKTHISIEIVVNINIFVDLCKFTRIGNEFKKLR